MIDYTKKEIEFFNKKIKQEVESIIDLSLDRIREIHKKAIKSVDPYPEYFMIELFSTWGKSAFMTAIMTISATLTNDNNSQTKNKSVSIFLKLLKEITSDINDIIDGKYDETKH